MTIVSQYLSLITVAVVIIVKFILLIPSHIFDILCMIFVMPHLILRLFPLGL
jgi:hypothetical protein